MKCDLCTAESGEFELCARCQDGAEGNNIEWDS